MDNVTPIDHTGTSITTHATTLAEFPVVDFAISKGLDAQTRTTETAHASRIVRRPKLPGLAQTSAGITTSKFDGVITIRAPVLTTAKTANATDIKTGIFREQLARSLEDITRKKRTNLDKTATRATSTSSVAATGQTTSATQVFHRRITRVRVRLLEAITHRPTRDAIIMTFPVHIL